MSQAPDNAPDFYETRTTPPRCTVPGCEHPSHLVTIWAGRRCRRHAPGFSSDVAVSLIADGWPDAASAYERYYHRECP